LEDPNKVWTDEERKILQKHNFNIGGDRASLEIGHFLVTVRLYPQHHRWFPEGSTYGFWVRYSYDWIKNRQIHYNGEGEYYDAFEVLVKKPRGTLQIRQAFFEAKEVIISELEKMIKDTRKTQWKQEQ
jgi:hypothetical protein